MTDILKDIVDKKEDSMNGRFLTFMIEEEMYGIELKNVIEIVGIQPIISMPKMPDYIKGIINLRSKIIPIMDVRLRFKKPEKEYNDRTCIIVVNYGALLIGLIVDVVYEVLPIAKEDIANSPEIGSGGNHGYVNGVGKIGEKVVLLIDCEKLLNEENSVVF